MAEILKKEYLTFDDVLIQPQYSEVLSREHISTSSAFLGLKLNIPVISSNMDYVTGPKMAIAMHQAGGLGILHRFMPWPEQLSAMQQIADAKAPVAFSVGVRDSDEAVQKTMTAQFNFGDDIIVCIDVAHGDHKRVVDLCKKIKALGVKIVAGNVATANAYVNLAYYGGADAVKIGIGPGSVCTTREVTGAGVPQLSAIMEIAEKRFALGLGTKLIADGGIKNSGDMVKALAAGADTVMLGNLLAGSSECPGEALESPTGARYKQYRGQSIFGTNGVRKSPEGISGYIKEKGPVADVLQTLVGGLRSGMSYVGASNLEELRENTYFIRVSPGTKVESETRVSTQI